MPNITLETNNAHMKDLFKTTTPKKKSCSTPSSSPKKPVYIKVNSSPKKQDVSPKKKISQNDRAVQKFFNECEIKMTIKSKNSKK